VAQPCRTHGLLRAACTGGAGQLAPGARIVPAWASVRVPVAPGGLRSLTKLDISLNALTNLPTEVNGLASLRILFSLGNQFEEVPPVLRGLPSLYMLSFKSNKLARIAEVAAPPRSHPVATPCLSLLHPLPCPIPLPCY